MIRRTNGDDTDDPGKLGGGGSPIVEPPETDLDVSLRTPKGARKNQTQADTVPASRHSGGFQKGRIIPQRGELQFHAWWEIGPRKE